MYAHSQEIEDALEVGNKPTAPDERDAFNQQDRPFLFGDDVIDGVHGVINIAKNAHIILRAPSPARCDHVPAIAIGGGPSLKQHIPALRKLQHKCLLIAAQTSVKGLLEAGITPHMSSPMERPRVMRKYLPDNCGSMVFAGAPLVHPDVMNKFNRHVYLPSGDCVYRWCGLPNEHIIYFGSSTGTTAVNAAASMTTQKIYLVGHDLAFDNDSSHWEGSQAPGVKRTDQEHWIDGNNGERLRTEHFWRRLCEQLSETTRLHPHIVNVNAYHKVGAKIPGTLCEDLPDPDSLPDFTLPMNEPNEERLKRWKHHAKLMPYHARKLRKFFQSAKSIAPKDTDILRAGVGDNAYAFAYMMVSILTQLSYECRMGAITHDQCLGWLKTATDNFLTNGKDFFEQIAECAHAP